MSRKFLWLVLVGVAINRLCSILPSEWYFEDPFLLYDYGRPFQVQAYVYMITIHIGVIATWYGFYQLKNEFSKIFCNFLIIEIVSLVDFILIYEHPWFHICDYGVEFTDAKILLYAYYIIRWNGNLNT